VGKEFVHLGLQIRRTRDGGVRVYQGNYAQQLVSEWGLSGCNPVPTPMVEDGEPVPESGEGAEQADVQPSADDIQQAQKATGGLLWLSTMTRIDSFRCVEAGAVCNSCAVVAAGPGNTSAAVLGRHDRPWTSLQVP
jgi:hypothetical protein